MEDWSSNGLPLVVGDDLLNFSLDVDEHKQNDKNNSNLCSLSSSYASGGSSSLPADEEEELEWLSNKDSFPVVEYDILDDKLDVGILGQHSPVSVLESSPAGGNENGKSGTNNWTGRGTLLVPGGFPNFARKKRIARKPRIGFGQHKHLFLVGHQINVVNVLKSPIPPAKVGRNKVSNVGRRCSHCGTNQTPLWRTGPMGRKTSCNACGMRYRSGRLYPKNQISVVNVQESPIPPVKAANVQESPIPPAKVVNVLESPIPSVVNVQESPIPPTKVVNVQESPIPLEKVVRNKASIVGRRCSYCGTDQTPRWRSGPMGPKTLCNACEVRYKSLYPENLTDVNVQESPIPPAENLTDVNVQEFPIPPAMVVRNEASTVGRRCSYCGTDQTPQWRSGPLGPKTLCNACGVRYKSLYPENLTDVNVRKSPICPEKVVKNKAPTVGRRCSHCGTDQTPQWRAGPMGLKTLCNACGVRYKSGRLVPEYRPASSPTFSPAMHSNSHRKIMEMRKLKEVGLVQQ